MRTLLFLLLSIQCFSQPGKGKDQNLLSRWSCNDGSSTVAGDHAGVRHLTLTNGPTWGTNTIVYDGTNDYSIRSAVDFGLNNTTEFSISFTLKTSDASGRVIQKTFAIDLGINTFRIYISATGVINFELSDPDSGGFPNWSNQSVVDFSTTKRVTFTFKVNSLLIDDGKIYIDGSEVTADFTSNNYGGSFLLFEESADFIVAIRPFTLTDPLAGEVGSIKIFNRMLTAAQVATLAY